MTNDDTRAIEKRLKGARPGLSPGFENELRHHLLNSAGGPSPQRLRLLIVAYAASGLLLLAIAAIGLASAGPLAS
jgi:hypothetical protein